VRNECLLHARLHECSWTGAARRRSTPLNRKIYAELFLTPDSGPWLGLAPADVVFPRLNGGAWCRVRTGSSPPGGKHRFPACAVRPERLGGTERNPTPVGDPSSAVRLMFFNVLSPHLLAGW